MQDFSYILSKMPAQAPPEGMLDRIMASISSQRSLANLKRKALAFATGLTVLSGFMLAFWGSLSAEISSSSFLAYVRVMFTDYDLFFASWKEIVLSLLESLPVVNLITFALFAFLALGLFSKLFQIWSQSHHGQKFFNLNPNI